MLEDVISFCHFWIWSLFVIAIIVLISAIQFVVLFKEVVLLVWLIFSSFSYDFFKDLFML
jgi:hypothetical protein